MPRNFWKMHGAGNDFVLFDARQAPLPLTPARIAALCHRQTGIGCDTLVVLESAADASVGVRFYNQDGSESGACGNASRCVADLIWRETRDTQIAIRSIAGLLHAARQANGEFQIDMGEPGLAAIDVPLAQPVDTLHLPLVGDPAACSMGNPHATWFVDDVRAADLAALGGAREHDPLFSARANIGFAHILTPDRIRLRVWERGVGFTLACGTGACAALVNAHRRGLASRRAEMIVDGGVLTIEWAANNHVLMTGPSALVFEGSVDLDAFPA